MPTASTHPPAQPPYPSVNAELLGALTLLLHEVYESGNGVAKNDGWPKAVEASETAIARARAESNPQPAEAKTAAVDKQILDWLEIQVVSVRTPLRYGSREDFIAGPEDNDGEFLPSELREKVLAKLATSQPAEAKTGAANEEGAQP